MPLRALSFAAAAVLCILTSTGAIATAQRTFVASSGNDANPCSLTLPCRGFAAAVAQTISGGEVIVLDSAGYGPVTIGQSVSIIAPPGVFAGISVLTFGPGVDVAAASATVVVRGLTINGAAGGAYGVRMSNGSRLEIEDCEISHFNYGVLIETAATVNIARSTLRDNTFGVVARDGSTLTIAASQVLKSASSGIRVDVGAPGDTTSVVIVDSLITGAGLGFSTYCIDNNPSGVVVGNISATRVTVTDCQWAFNNEPTTAGTLTVSNSMVAGNVYGFLHQAGSFLSLGNNHVSGNQFDTSGTITTIGGQ